MSRTRPSARPGWSAAGAAARLELRHLVRDRAYVALTVLAAVSFLGLVSLFGLTASDAPMALIVRDRGPYVRPFVEALVKVPHAFRLARMTEAEAEERLGQGHLVGAIVIPAGFSAEIARGGTVAIDVEIDNVNVDVVADVQRALPAAIVGFGHDVGLPGLRVRLDERDVWPRDTHFLPYITVSGLGLVSLLVAGVLAAMAMTREWEGGTMKLWRLAPAPLGYIVLGKAAATALVSLGAIALTTAVVVVGYGVAPRHPLSAGLGLVVCASSFTLLGAWLGAWVRRSLVLLPLLFGLAMPLYIDSGALEPTRFDGELAFRLAHATPLYYAVGYLEWAFFGLRITPEPPWVNLAVLGIVGLLAFALTLRRLAAAPPRGRLA